jgi:SAM-dependent methyltransferase
MGEVEPMLDNNWRQRLKPFAARFGVTSSSVMWSALALHYYKKKFRNDTAYRQWAETEGPRWVAEHWGHEVVAGDFMVAHMTSQLYELTEMLRRRIGSVGTDRVLDAGASDGLFLTRVGAVRGVGVNFLQACAQNIKRSGFESCVANIETLPFSDKSFDHVICCETLEHVCNPIHTLNELSRVCKHRIYLTIPWLARTRLNRRPQGWPEVESHIFEFGEDDFAKILSHARVRVVYQDRVQVFPEPRNPLTQNWLRLWMYKSFFPKLQYYELEPC